MAYATCGHVTDVVTPLVVQTEFETCAAGPGGQPMAPSYAEPLRVVGQWLDLQSPDEIELITTVHTITIRWRRHLGPRDFHTFDWTEIYALSEQARMQRQNPFGRMTGRWAPALRTLGQELDAQCVELLLARSQDGGLQVYGLHEGGPYAHWFADQHLAEWNTAQRTQRIARLLRAQSRKPPSWSRRWKSRGRSLRGSLVVEQDIPHADENANATGAVPA
jgi:hypothetical protein